MSIAGPHSDSRQPSSMIVVVPDKNQSIMVTSILIMAILSDTDGGAVNVDPHQWQGCHQPGARFVTTPKPGRGPYLGKSGPTGSPSSTGTSADGPHGGGVDKHPKRRKRGRAKLRQSHRCGHAMRQLRLCGHGGLLRQLRVSMPIQFGIPLPGACRGWRFGAARHQSWPRPIPG